MLAPWIWELSDWPRFRYDSAAIAPQERAFLMAIGSESATLNANHSCVTLAERQRFLVEVLTSEGLSSSRIEGELLDHTSLHSSILRHFGLNAPQHSSPKEEGMATLLCDLYSSYDAPLSHEMLWRWHAALFQAPSHLTTVGSYRTHPEPMQIVEPRRDGFHVHYEAPPSARVADEMEAFVTWFNDSRSSPSLLARAAAAHIYFESIHPFEDGNGRIGRAIAEKALAQGIGRPLVIALSSCLDKRRKEYYGALARCNHALDVQPWVEFFAEIALQAAEEAIAQLSLLLAKSTLLNTLADRLNPRQTKALLCLFAAGPEGFKEGLSAEKYIAITKATRATATRDLAGLVAMGALTKTGTLRHTRYWLNLPTP